MKTEFTVSGENAGVHLLLHFAMEEAKRELIRLAEEKKQRSIRTVRILCGRKDREQNRSVILLGYANMSDEKSCMRLVCLMKHGIKRRLTNQFEQILLFEKENTSKLMFRRVLVNNII